MGAYPRISGHIGDGVLLSSEIGHFSEASIQHLQKASGLPLVALDGVRNLLGRVAIEDVRLPHHWADTRHLKHQPLNGARAALPITWKESLGLLGQVNQDGARLEDGEIIFVAIDDGGDPAIGVDLEELRTLLFELRERELVDPVRKAHLFEGDGDFLAIRSGGGIEVDHLAYRIADRLGE